ncbi:MAG TPA: hypothetical protein VE713_00765, partial [Pyrinomonadaceae bacterium]|nr:hypothetical protein [Pyrinomonadaceae bacterium]
RGHNSRSKVEEGRAYEQGELNAREYMRQLEGLKPLLTDEAYRFFTGESLHDGRLLSFAAGDGINFDVHGSDKFDINAQNPSAQMRVLGASLDALYTLRYTEVKKVLFDYPTDDPLFHGEGGHIGDWGYDELTAAGDDYLRHEILFASGTTILIEFRHFSWEREECEGSRYT